MESHKEGSQEAFDAHIKQDRSKREREQHPAFVLDRIKERIKGYKNDKALEPHLLDNFLAITQEIEGVHNLDVKLKSVMADVEQRIKNAVDNGSDDKDGETVLAELQDYMRAIEEPEAIPAFVGNTKVMADIREVARPYYNGEINDKDKGYHTGLAMPKYRADCMKKIGKRLEQYLDEYIAKAELVTKE